MVKFELKFVCPLCRDKYSSFRQARNCEKKGTADLSLYPEGLMFQSRGRGDEPIILALTKVEHYLSDKHLGSTHYWATRPFGDTLGIDEYCGHDFLNNDIGHWKKWHHVKSEVVGNPEFVRMVEFLKSIGIVPRYYDENGVLVTVD